MLWHIFRVVAIYSWNLKITQGLTLKLLSLNLSTNFLT